MALGLKFPSFGGYELHRDRAKEEPVYEPKALEGFLQFMSTQDVRYETTPYTPLPAEEAARRRLEFSKLSQESDDEDMTPAPFCSGCGSAVCRTGADRCSRQRKNERLELVTEYIFEVLSEQVETNSSIQRPDRRVAPRPQPRRRLDLKNQGRGPETKRPRDCTASGDLSFDS